MTIRSWSAVLLSGLSVAFVGVERRHHHRSADAGPNDRTVLVTPPPPVDRTFADASGICFHVPAAWRTEPAKTAVLAVTAPAAVGDVCLNLDVPAMSWHPPFIPLGMVVSRYLDALRQGDIPDAQVQESADVAVPGATAHRVRARGHEHGRFRVDDAVVLIHRGQIFILSADSDDAGAPAARAALDAAVASIHWAK